MIFALKITEEVLPSGLQITPGRAFRMILALDWADFGSFADFDYFHLPTDFLLRLPIQGIIVVFDLWLFVEGRRQHQKHIHPYPLHHRYSDALDTLLNLFEFFFQNFFDEWGVFHKP